MGNTQRRNPDVRPIHHGLDFTCGMIHLLCLKPGETITAVQVTGQITKWAGFRVQQSIQKFRQPGKAPL